MVDLTPLEIGEYTGCTHGEGGARKLGCHDCAIRWHVKQADEADQRMSFHEARVMQIRYQRDRDAKRSIEADAAKGGE